MHYLFQIELTLKNLREFRLVDTSNKARICVCGGQSATHQFTIVPRQLGKINITVRVSSIFLWSMYFEDIRDQRKSSKNVLDYEGNLTLPMLRLLLSKAQGSNDFRKPSKPCCVCINWIALASTPR